MALSDILDKIKEETDAKMKEINEQHEAKLSTLEGDFKEKEEKAKAEMDEQVTVNSKKILNKMETLAKMEANSKLLREKRELLDSVFAGALEQLTAASNYQDMVTSLLKGSELEGDDVTVIPAKGKEEATRSALSASGKSYQMAETSANIKGGFILQSDKIEINNSFESILHKQLRDDLELDIAKMLFN
jgi:V/A-type H+/Na+-transporting ATPase subunit E